MLYKRTKGLISVVITCYNVESFIEDCLDGLLNQTYKNIEVIIVNDASTDQTVQKIEDWEKKMDPHFDIKLIDLPSNVGFSGSLNIGYFLSSGEFIAVHDGDDISHPERLERQIKFLKDNPDIDLVGTNYSYFPTGDFSNQTKANWLKFGDDILKTYAHGGHCVCHGTILFRGKVFDQLGGPTRRVKGAEDYEFIVKFLNAQLKIDNLPEVLYYYRSHPNQRSRQFFTKASDKQ